MFKNTVLSSLNVIFRADEHAPHATDLFTPLSIGQKFPKIHPIRKRLRRIKSQGKTSRVLLTKEVLKCLKENCTQDVFNFKHNTFVCDLSQYRMLLRTPIFD